MTRFAFCWLINFLIVLISATDALSQKYLDPNKRPDQYNFENWTSDDGLPDNAIINLLQSHDGYIWFVSYGGITRFNGVEFYTYNAYNHPEITNNSFTSIFEDKEGTIWAATSGNGAVAVNKNRVKAFTIEEGLASNFVESFTQTKDGVLWVATSEGLVYKQDSIFVSTGLPIEIRNKNIVSITSDDNDHIWIATANDGVYEMYKNRIIAHYNVQSGLLTVRINFIDYQKGKIYIGTEEGLNIIENDQITSLSKNDGLPEDNIIAVQMSNNGWLWIGSYKGFCRVKAGEVQYFSQQHPIFSRDITSILEDVEGNLWVSTYRGGLYKFWEGKFTNYCDYSLSPSQPYTVHTILQKNTDEFVLVYEEGVSIVNTSKNTLGPLDEALIPKYDKLKYGHFDQRKRLLIGARNGLIIYNPNGQFRHITTDDGLINDNVRLIYEDRQNRIWVGTIYGISVFDLDFNLLFNLSANDGLSHEYIMSIAEDEKGNFWIGTRSGLNYYADGKFTHYGAKDGMAGDFVFKTYADTNGALWILGNAGITRYKNGKFVSVTARNGLTSNTVFQILEDDYGNFWFTTNQKNISVFKVNKEELHDFCDGKIDKVNSIEYDRSDGIKATAATSSALSLEAADGKFWIATQFGAEVIDPSNIQRNEIKPPVAIEYLKLNDIVLPHSDDIEISAGKNRIAIGFSSLSYRYPSNNQYKYILEGYDDHWITSKGERETSYTNLSPGTYTFKVIAANNDDAWNEVGAEITFNIKPAFYQTAWFIFTCVFVVVGLAYLVYYLRVTALKKARAQLELMVAERTHEILQKKEEIEAQNEEIDAQKVQIEKQHEELKKVNLYLEEMVEQRTKELKTTYRELLDVNKELDTFIYRSVHDIRGPIARLQGLSHLIKMQTEDGNILNLVGMLNTTAEEMNDIFYRLINIVRLKSSDLRLGVVNVFEVVNNVLHKFMTSPLKDVFEVEMKINKDLTLVSNRETIEIILHQIIDNAIKFRTPTQVAKIEISAQRLSNSLVKISIADYGGGILPDQEDKIFDMFYVGNDNVNSSGLGLYTVRTAAKALNSEVKLSANSRKGGKTVFDILLTDQIKL